MNRYKKEMLKKEKERSNWSRFAETMFGGFLMTLWAVVNFSISLLFFIVAVEIVRMILGLR